MWANVIHPYDAAGTQPDHWHAKVPDTMRMYPEVG
jgi:hypothetical protein